MSPLLCAEGIVVLRNRRRVLDGVSLAVHAGEVLALLGPNGSGKSTLLEVLLGARRPDHGGVWLAGEPATRLTAAQRARRVTLVVQDTLADLPLSVEEVVALGVRAQKSVLSRLSGQESRRIDSAIAEAGLEALRSRRMDTLSGGERQRTHLARAQAQGAPVLLLDEPTAHLDLLHQLEVVELAARHARGGGAAVIAMHDLTLAARAAHRVALLASGRWLACGAPADVLSSSNLAVAFGIRAHVGFGCDGSLERLIVLGRAAASRPC